MNYADSISRSVAYIELHLNEKIALPDIAAQANLSIAHLYRIFPAFTGCTIGQYVRQRRMTEAARMLRENKRILDIALEYQFDSQESFTRAFKVMFGITPGEYRHKPVVIPVYLPAQISLDRKDEVVKQPEIVVKQLNLLGTETGIDLETDFTEQIAVLTEEIKLKLATVRHLVQPVRTINMWYPHFEDETATSEPVTMFFSGIEISAEIAAALGAASENLIVKAFPESLYAVFEERQRGTVGGPDGYAYRIWLPSSGYDLNERIPGDMEVYPDTEHTGYDDFCNIWIPVSDSRPVN